MTAYWISSYLEISDPDKVAAYAELAGPAIAAAGGAYVARGVAEVAHEDGVAQRTVIVRFPTVEAAEACYTGAEYQRALDVLGDGARRDVRFVAGVPEDAA